jgi:two-component system sensor histidine kinase/response regulator
MTKNKTKSSSPLKDLKSIDLLADGSLERQLISLPQNSVLCDIAAEFDDQFHYLIKVGNKKVEAYFSPSIESVTGYTPKELIKLSMLGRELIVDEDLPNFKKQLTLIESGEVNSLELSYRINRKDGNIVWLKEQMKFDVGEDGIKTFIGLVIDVTKFQQSADLLNKDIEKLKNKVQARDNFISILSHDLRAPFSSILGFTEILLSGAVLTDAEKTEYLNYINDSSSNQLRLVNYLLDWSNLQTGRMNIDKNRVQAQGLVFNCISALTGNAMRKNIDIKVNVPASIFIEVDERLMIQAITNLVSNAIKFSEEGKTINITADRFNNNLAEFVVRDEGIGIPEHYSARIFKFDKMFSTRGTRGERGTGLGLSLVKEIIERHNGEIWYYSKEKVGSEFHFTVPSSENTILLVENHKEDFLKIEKLITENYPEFKFVGTDNGFEAINIVLKHHPSLIISSHNLPLMNGVQFVKSILRGDKKFYAPIIAIVDSNENSVIKSYHEIGIKSILCKPVDLKLFNREMALALN